MENRKCRTCSELKDIDDYHKHNGTYRLDCKICFRLHEKERRLNRVKKTDIEHAQKIIDYRFKLNSRGVKPENHSWCYECNDYKINDDFSQYNLNHNGKCRECSNEYDIQRNRKLKIKAINYLGGKCVYCEFNGHYSSFDFHHLDPKEKEFNWNEGRKKSWGKITPELDKCVLVCSNCHNQVHCKLNNDGTLNENYTPKNNN